MSDNLWAELQASAEALANLNIIKTDDKKPAEQEVST